MNSLKILLGLFLVLFFTAVTSQSTPFLGQPGGSSVEVYDEKCLNDPLCHRNVTACLYEGCCSHKICTPKGGCNLITPKCAEPVDNTTCLYDSECRHNVTVCPFTNCCSYKRCPYNGGTCLVMLANCAVPAERSEDETCLYDKTCQKNVRICYTQDCCSVKECNESGECKVNIPLCTAQIEQNSGQVLRPRKTLGLKTNRNYSPPAEEP